ncbi:MAG: hypothetical protein VXX36_06645 [Verrucomicrobiota bacterium]|nr:hypothetical protein [Verrucomicrobiota bacterium]
MRRWFRYERNDTDVRIPFGHMVAITLKGVLTSIPRIIVSPASAESASGCRQEEQPGNEVNDNSSATATKHSSSLRERSIYTMKVSQWI